MRALMSVGRVQLSDYTQRGMCVAYAYKDVLGVLFRRNRL